MRAYRGRIFCLERHTDRLFGSLRALGQEPNFFKKEIEGWVESSLKESKFSEAMVRLSVHGEPSGKSRWVVIVREFKPYPKEWFEKGIELRTATRLKSSVKAQDSKIKCSEYAGSILAHLDAAARPGGEFVFLNQNLTVSECAVSNIFIVRAKTLLTPAPASGILEGVTRSAVIELAGKEDIEVRETFLTRHEVYTAEECFITNTSFEILPVSGMDGRKINGGTPGPVTRKLMAGFKLLCTQSKER